MGFPKLFLPFNRKQNFGQRLTNEYYKAGCGPIILVLNRCFSQVYYQKRVNALKRHASITINPHPELGRLYSIQLGLKQLRRYHQVIIQNVDNPFIAQADIERLLAHHQHSQADYCQPAVNGKGEHPVLVTQPVIQAILEADPTKSTLHDILKPFQGCRMETDSAYFAANINSPEDYKYWFRPVKERSRNAIAV